MAFPALEWNRGCYSAFGEGGRGAYSLLSSLLNSALWNINTEPYRISSCLLLPHQGQTPFDVADEGLVEHLEMLQKKQTVVSFWQIIFHLSNYLFTHGGSLRHMAPTDARSWGPAIFFYVSHLESLIAPIFLIARNAENWMTASRKSVACWHAGLCRVVRNV